MRSQAKGADATRVLIVAPVPPPYGGMALQAQLLARLLRETGVPAEVLGYNQPFARPWRIPERVPALRTVLRAATFCARLRRRSRQCEVVHILACSWLYFFLIVAPAVALGRIAGKRVIVNYRGGDADDFLKRYGRLARPVFRAASTVTAPSEFLAAVIRTRLGVPVSIVPNIVNFSIFRYRERRPFRPKMLATRHLQKLYGIDTVLRAFRKIQANWPDASLRIAGTGPEESHLRQLAAEWELKNVQFLGYLDHKRLPDVYDECDILLNGSRVDNFPGSLMEASASGLAVVSTVAGGIPFLYEDRKNALLVAIDDSDAMAAAVEKLLADQALARDLAEAGRDVCRQCEWSNVRQSLFETYHFMPPEKESALPYKQLAWSAGGKDKL